MNITLAQLRAIDSELVVEGNKVYLHDKVEYISSISNILKSEEWAEWEEEFTDAPHFHKFDLGDDENVGVIYSENFPKLVDTTLEEYESLDNTPQSGVFVEVYRVWSSLFPVVVEFPTDSIVEDTEYEVEYCCEDSIKTFEDIEGGDNTLRVCAS